MGDILKYKSMMVINTCTLRILALILLLNFINFNLFSQNEKDKYRLDTLMLRKARSISNNKFIPQIIPPSPSSSAIEQYMNLGSECNGVPNVDVFLYNINTKEGNIPINLTYNTSGIKHTDIDSPVGTGWMMNVASFRVFRTIKGYPDEDLSYSFYDKQLFLDTSSIERTTAATNESLAFPLFINNNTESNKVSPKSGDAGYSDGGIDIFTYNTPTTSGSFVIINRNNLEVAIIEKKSDIIKLERKNNKIVSVKVTDNYGITYVYGGDGYYEEIQNHPQISYRSGWLLNKIIYPQGEEVLFLYHNYRAVEKKRTKWLAVSDGASYYAGGCTDCPSEADYTVDSIPPSLEHSRRLLKQISTTYENVVFEYKESDKDIEMIAIYIDSKISTFKKDIQFFYRERDNACWHKLLNQIYFNWKEDNSITRNSYSFDYYLPKEDEKLQKFMVKDQWGYYSFYALSNNKYDQCYLHTDFKNEPYIYNHSRFSTIGYLLKNNQLISWVDKSRNYGNHHYFSLKGMKHPTGGITLYKYESNKYLDSNGKIVEGGGQRIKEIHQTLGRDIVSSYRYNYNQNTNGVGIANFPDYGWKDFVKNDLYVVLNSGFWASHPSERYMMGRREYMEELANLDMQYFKVSYKNVSIEQNNHQGEINGKTVLTYSSPCQYFRDGHSYQQAAYIDQGPIMATYIFNNKNKLPITKYREGFTPNLIRKQYYNKSDILVKEEVFDYYDIESTVIEGLNIEQKIFLESYYGTDTDLSTLLGPYPKDVILSYINYNFYDIVSGTNKIMKAKKTTEYLGDKDISFQENYFYDDKHRLIREDHNLNNNDNITTEIIYPSPLEYPMLSNKNMISTKLEEITTKNGKRVSHIKHCFSPERTLPDSIQSLYNQDMSITNVVFDEYDKMGNITQLTTNNGFKKVYIWSYNGKYPIAEISNTTIYNVKRFIDTETLLLKTPTVEDITQIRELYSKIDGINIITYTYSHPHGVASVIDPAGLATYYNYKYTGKLSNVFIGEPNINGAEKRISIEKYNYHYSK